MEKFDKNLVEGLFRELSIKEDMAKENDLGKYVDEFEFNGNKIKYYIEGNKSIISLISSCNQSVCRIDITNNNFKSDISDLRVEVMVEDANADYIVKRIDIDNDSLMVDLDNEFGPYGNYVDGVKRTFKYCKSYKRSNKYLHMIETQWPTTKNGNYLYCRNSDDYNLSVELNGETLLKNLSDMEFDTLASQIARHPRNKDLISFTLNELDKQFPGLEEFISNKFPIYNFIIGSEYEATPSADFIVKQTINAKCDLKVENDKQKKLQ